MSEESYIVYLLFATVICCFFNRQNRLSAVFYFQEEVVLSVVYESVLSYCISIRIILYRGWVEMPIWEIIGPVMIGPSSSHTAGAVRLGLMVRMCWSGNIKKADIYMRGSFATTGSGHGTDRAILAGLLGYMPDDPAVRDGIELARNAGIDFHFYEEDVEGAHPNSARIVISDGEGRTMDAVGASVGGGAVVLQELDGFQVEISGVLPAIIIMNRDVHGVVGAVTSFLSSHNINIATMKLHRDARGGLATMVLELDATDTPLKFDGLCAVHPAIVRVITIPGVA